MHDPQFGLGIDTRVMLWHPCEAKVYESDHNNVDWVRMEFSRQLTLREGAWSRELVEVQVRREVARDLMCRLLELFPVEAGRITCSLTNVSIRQESSVHVNPPPAGPPPDDPPSE